MAGRVATNREAGEFNLAQMLHEWALHDLGHIRQDAGLVRAREDLNGAGPLGRSYQLEPCPFDESRSSCGARERPHPHFGIYGRNQGFMHETGNFEFAIATSGRRERLPGRSPGCATGIPDVAVSLTPAGERATERR